MKMFKKLFMVAVLFTSLFMFSACGGNKEANVEGTLEEIMTQVYAKVNELGDEEKPMLANMPVDSESAEYYLGSADLDFKEALACEPMMGSIAHSTVLVRANEGADIEALKQTIKEKVNPQKWICVGVAPEDVIVESKGDLVILIMVEDAKLRQMIQEGFAGL